MLFTMPLSCLSVPLLYLRLLMLIAMVTRMAMDMVTPRLKHTQATQQMGKGARPARDSTRRDWSANRSHGMRCTAPAHDLSFLDS